MTAPRVQHPDPASPADRHGESDDRYARYPSLRDAVVLISGGAGGAEFVARFARPVRWLAADDSRSCTGQHWVVDGGWMHS